uniref:Uncharacterized protein n=1 Tax=Anopheles farauti TaxID=69004 RepID=A0A182QQA7_9DIPT
MVIPERGAKLDGLETKPRANLYLAGLQYRLPTYRNVPSKASSSSPSGPPEAGPCQSFVPDASFMPSFARLPTRNRADASSSGRNSTTSPQNTISQRGQADVAVGSLHDQVTLQQRHQNAVPDGPERVEMETPASVLAGVHIGRLFDPHATAYMRRQK